MKKTSNKTIFLVSEKDCVIEKGFNIRHDLDLLDLKTSIKKWGIKVPLLGKYDKKSGKWTIVNGHRRLLAVRELGKKIEIPIIEVTKHYTDEEKNVDLFILNSGKNLTLLEQAELFERLKTKFKLNVQQIANRIGKSIQHVRDCNVLLTADSETKEMIRKGEVSATMVIQMLRKGDAEETSKKLKEAKKGKEKVTKKDVDKIDKKINTNTGEVFINYEIDIKWVIEKLEAKNVPDYVIDILNVVKDFAIAEITLAECAKELKSLKIVS